MDSYHQESIRLHGKSLSKDTLQHQGARFSSKEKRLCWRSCITREEMWLMKAVAWSRAKRSQATGMPRGESLARRLDGCSKKIRSWPTERIRGHTLAAN